MTAGKIPDSETAPDFGESSTWNIAVFPFSGRSSPRPDFKIGGKIKERAINLRKEISGGFCGKWMH